MEADRWGAAGGAEKGGIRGRAGNGTRTEHRQTQVITRQNIDQEASLTLPNIDLHFQASYKKIHKHEIKQQKFVFFWSIERRLSTCKMDKNKASSRMTAFEAGFDRRAGSLALWLAMWFSGWLCSSLAVWPVLWLVLWLALWLSSWLAGSLALWLAGWLALWLASFSEMAMTRS